jgi:hypothetical protein
MKNSKKKVYDAVYGSKEISYESPKGVIGFLYRKFIRFEVNRYKLPMNCCHQAEKNCST